MNKHLETLECNRSSEPLSVKASSKQCSVQWDTHIYYVMFVAHMQIVKERVLRERRQQHRVGLAHTFGLRHPTKAPVTELQCFLW